MEGFFFPIVSSFLTSFEMINYATTNREAYAHIKKLISTLKIFKFWYFQKTSKWMNGIVRRCLNMHVFGNRISISNAPIHKVTGGLSKLNKNRSKKKFFNVTSYMFCDCKESKIDTAVYYALGESMYKSVPCLDFCCRSCVDKIISCTVRDNYHIFHETTVFLYPQENCTDLQNTRL